MRKLTCSMIALGLVAGALPATSTAQDNSAIDQYQENVPEAGGGGGGIGGGGGGAGGGGGGGGWQRGRRVAVGAAVPAVAAGAGARWRRGQRGQCGRRQRRATSAGTADNPGPSGIRRRCRRGWSVGGVRLDEDLEGEARAR